MIVEKSVRECYKFRIKKDKNIYILDPKPVIEAIVKDIESGVTKEIISAKFHRGLSGMILEVSNLLREETGINIVCLTGGVFQNIVLRKEATAKLQEGKFKVYNHKKIPPNDGGISAGQVAIAMKRFKN